MISKNKLLQLFDGNDHLVESYIELAKKEIPIELDELLIYLKRDNYKDASIIAHSIKGQCNYLDLKNCSYIAEQIEIKADKNEFLNDKYHLYDKLKFELEEALSI
jgi:HPt (histidine-containing phosphotransfer) domain-containing protein